MFNAQRYVHVNDAYFAPSTIRFPYESKKIFDQILHELQYLDKVHPRHFTLDLDQLDRIFEYRAGCCFSFPVTNVELEYMFDTLGCLWLHYHTYYISWRNSLMETSAINCYYCSISSCDWYQSIIQRGTSNRYRCDGMEFTVHGNATIKEQTGPKHLYSVEQWKALELMTIVEEKCPIAQRDGLSSKKVQLKAERKSP